MRKAPRDYGITNEHLMYANVLIIQCLQKLYNVIFTYGAIPKEWKRGLIVPIFKGGDNSCNSYHPVTLLPSVSKVFKKIIMRKIFDSLNESRITFPNILQQGF